MRLGNFLVAMATIPAMTGIMAVAAAAWSYAGSGQTTDLGVVFGFSFSSALVFCLSVMAPLTAFVEITGRPMRWLYPLAAGCFALWVATLLDGETAASTYVFATAIGVLSGLAWWWQVQRAGRRRLAHG